MTGSIYKEKEMADPLGNFVPEFIENEVEREAIVKLAKMITDRVPQKLGMKKITKYDPEYWGLSAMCTDEMAEVALKMGVRKPKTLDEMVEDGTPQKIAEKYSDYGVPDALCLGK